MKPTFVLCMCLSVSLTLVAQANPPGSARIVEEYGKLPLAFEANQGQSDPQVKFLSRGAGYSLLLTSNEAVLALHEASRQEPALPGAKAPASPAKTSRQSKSAVLRMKLVGSNARTEVTGQDELPGKSNYFIGNDPKKWHTNVRQFAKVRYENVYPGVDLVYYGHQRELEYDFVVRPGVNPQAIRLGIEGARRLRLEHGDLVMTSAVGDVHLRSPHIYQEANGMRQEVRGRYVITSKNELGFEVASYDRRRALVIDPVLAYSTYFENGGAIAVDSAGNAYITGGPNGAFVTKLNADGTAIVYSFYLGGSGFAAPGSIAVDTAGNAYVTGITTESDFPTVNAFQPNYGGSFDGFVLKISAAGSALVYSSYLGGSDNDEGSSIAADAAGNAYITGATTSTDFPTYHAFQPNYISNGNNSAFVTKVDAAGSLIYSTYLGGSHENEGSGIATDSAGNAYVTGRTTSADFPRANAIQPTYAGGWTCPRSCGDAFVTKFNASGSALVYSTYLGGSSSDLASGIAVDTAGNTYITGYTYSSDFPLVNAFQPNFGGGGSITDAFVSKINASGSALVYSTYLGGSKSEWGKGIAADSAGNAYVTGRTNSTDFPTVNAIQSSKRAYYDAFVTEFNSAGSALVYSTYLGGSGDDSGINIVVDSAGSAYVSGGTDSFNFPTTLLAFQQSPTYNFVTKIAQQTFVSASPTKLGFATRLVGTTSAAKKATVTNQGSGTLTINRIYIGGLDPSDFAETNTCGSTLAAGASCTISITFTLTDKQSRQAAAGISDSDPASPQAIALGGSGTVVSLSKKKLSFGDQQVGTSSAPQSVMLTNVGSTQLNFTGISITGTNPGDFSETNTCGTSIAGKASCTITVTFMPTAIGTRHAAVSISDDGGGSPQKVALTGTGT